MDFDFYKYQGAGNDFVFLDNVSGKFDGLTIEQVQKLCDRRFGIGADGLIKIDKSEEWDFNVDYYNSDGTKSFCGNGARCAVRFVNEQLFKKDTYKFSAIDGVHQGIVMGQNIAIEMLDVDDVEKLNENSFVLDTGSPHYIHFVDRVSDFNIYEFGKEIRYNDRFIEEGINVNAVEVVSVNNLSIRTYERGVENETLACGTGITAATIAYARKMNKSGDVKVNVKAMGGDLSVSLYATEKQTYKSINLIGPAQFVFKGSIDV